MSRWRAKNDLEKISLSRLIPVAKYVDLRINSFTGQVKRAVYMIAKPDSGSYFGIGSRE